MPLFNTRTARYPTGATANAAPGTSTISVPVGLYFLQSDEEVFRGAAKHIHKFFFAVFLAIATAKR